MYTVKDPELDLRKLIPNDSSDIDYQALEEKYSKMQEQGELQLPHVEESLDERIDRWIRTKKRPSSMSPEIAQRYMNRLNELRKKGAL